MFIALDLSDQRQQVGKRLLQEKDDKDLLILLGDIPKLKVTYNCQENIKFSSLWQEVEDLIGAACQSSLAGKGYLQGGRWWNHYHGVKMIFSLGCVLIGGSPSKRDTQATLRINLEPGSFLPELLTKLELQVRVC